MERVTGGERERAEWGREDAEKEGGRADGRREGKKRNKKRKKSGGRRTRNNRPSSTNSNDKRMLTVNISLFTNRRCG